MEIEIVTPGGGAPITGNAVTARRYARMLSQLGHRVTVSELYSGRDCDALIALHARRSFESIRRFREGEPRRPVILVLTGTDLYRDIQSSQEARSALDSATRLVVLQKSGLDEIPGPLKSRTAVIYQSATKSRAKLKRSRKFFQVCNIANLRKEKDPLRTAMAVRNLPEASRIRVVHIGRPLDEALALRAFMETLRKPRYRWVGEQDHRKTRKILAESRLFVITSRIEGSSNALSEALAASVPVIASRIPGLEGTLGNYPGFFPPGDTQALSILLARAETDMEFYAELAEACSRIKPLISPRRERNSWKDLLNSIKPDGK
jgi:putative glycosyltransferase (TIGR04348 family)